MRKKVCSRCKQEKDFDKDFTRSTSSPDGKDYWCKVCNNEKDRERMKKKKDNRDDFFNQFIG